ncbi:membrane protein [Striga asiatica]|uniref:Membrane protein n=1 Tax=Striga asiatica TaxID=4170 RepID=A0A5A7R6G1_STRAF|nr:membrane protein [Striga asiatica]
MLRFFSSSVSGQSNGVQKKFSPKLVFVNLQYLLLWILTMILFPLLAHVPWFVWGSRTLKLPKVSVVGSDTEFEYWFKQHYKHALDLATDKVKYFEAARFVRWVIFFKISIIPKKSMRLSKFVEYMNFSCIIKLYHCPHSIILRVCELQVRFSSQGLVLLPDDHKVNFDG